MQTVTTLFTLLSTAGWPESLVARMVFSWQGSCAKLPQFFTGVYQTWDTIKTVIWKKQPLWAQTSLLIVCWRHSVTLAIQYIHVHYLGHLYLRLLGSQNIWQTLNMFTFFAYLVLSKPVLKCWSIADIYYYPYTGMRYVYISTYNFQLAVSHTLKTLLAQWVAFQCIQECHF